jgi:MFS family permease
MSNAEPGLLENQPFRRLVVSRAVGQVAQTALLYALLIWVVEETASSIHTTLLVAAFTLPSIVFGIPAGAVAESLPRRPLLVLGYVLRALAAVAILYYRNDMWFVYLFLLGLSAVGQFTGPAESAALSIMVRRDQVAAANSFFVLSVMAGQVGGAVILAPLLLRILGVPAVLVVAAAVFLAAAVIVATVSGLKRGLMSPVDERERVSRLSIGAALAQGWRTITSNERAFMAMVYLTVAATLSRSLAVLAPQFASEVLKIDTENAVYVVAPAAVGALLALVLTPLLSRILGASRTAALGFLLLILGFTGLGFVIYVEDFILNHFDLGISFVEDRIGVSSVVTISMFLAVPVGLAMTMVTVASKAVLNQCAPQGTQTRVFATQSALSDAVSLPPLFLIGAIGELVGPRSVLLLAALGSLAVTVYLARLRRFRPAANE